MLPCNRQANFPQLVGSPHLMSKNSTGKYPRSTNSDGTGSKVGAYNIKVANRTILKTVYSPGSGATWNRRGEVLRVVTSTHGLGNQFRSSYPVLACCSSTELAPGDCVPITSCSGFE